MRAWGGGADMDFEPLNKHSWVDPSPLLARAKSCVNLSHLAAISPLADMCLWRAKGDENLGLIKTRAFMSMSAFSPAKCFGLTCE